MLFKKLDGIVKHFVILGNYKLVREEEEVGCRGWTNEYELEVVPRYDIYKDGKLIGYIFPTNIQVLDDEYWEDMNKVEEMMR